MEAFYRRSYPGLMLAGLQRFHNNKSHHKPNVVQIPEHYSFKQKLAASKELFPVLGLIFIVLGGIYLGFTTPTEAAAIGVVGAFILAIFFKNLTWKNFRQAVISAVKTTSMICFIIIGAAFLSQVVGFIGIARALSLYIVSLKLSPYLLIFVIGIMYLFLGMILDGISIVVMTLPIVLPIVCKFRV